MTNDEQVLLKRCFELTEVQGAFKALKRINDLPNGFEPKLEDEVMLAMAYEICQQRFQIADVEIVKYMMNANEPKPEIPKEVTRLESIE